MMRLLNPILTLATSLLRGKRNPDGNRKENKHKEVSRQEGGHQVRRATPRPRAEPSLMDMARRAGRHVSARTAANYLTAVRSLLRFCRRDDLPLKALTARLVGDYQAWLLARGVSRNTSSCYMRSLRALCRKAPGWQAGRRDPFARVFTGREATAKRSLSAGEVVRIRRLRLPGDTRLALARDMFLFCLYAMGMPFADAVRLRKGNIRGNTLTYRRRKTGRTVTVRLEPCMAEILRRHARAGSDLLFPVMEKAEGGSAEERERCYRSGLAYHNMLLREIGRQAGVEGDLSSYAARHTWATAAYSEGVALPVISQAMGHAAPSTTLIYIRGIDGRRLALEKKSVKSVFLSTSSEEVQIFAFCAAKLSIKSRKRNLLKKSLTFMLFR